MKIIKTNTFIQKWGYGNLPGDLQQQQIDKYFDPPEQDVKIDERQTELTVEDEGKEYTLTLDFSVRGYRDDPRNWEVNYTIFKVLDENGMDVTKWSKENDIPYGDVVELAIKEAVLNIV